MKYKTKSIIISKRHKKKGEINREFMLALFDINDPHKTIETPKENLKFKNISRVIVKNLDVHYLVEGSDVLINNLKQVDIKKNQKGHLTIQKI